MIVFTSYIDTQKKRNMKFTSVLPLTLASSEALDSIVKRVILGQKVFSAVDIFRKLFSQSRTETIAEHL